VLPARNAQAARAPDIRAPLPGGDQNSVMSGASDTPRSATDNEFAVAYSYLKQVVGLIAVTLPFV